jgi:hypothetical protein
MSESGRLITLLLSLPFRSGLTVCLLAPFAGFFALSQVALISSIRSAALGRLRRRLILLDLRCMRSKTKITGVLIISSMALISSVCTTRFVSFFLDSHLLLRR